MSLLALIAALHAGHAGGVNFGWIGPLASSLLVLAVLAISYRGSRK